MTSLDDYHNTLIFLMVNIYLQAEKYFHIFHIINEIQNTNFKYPGQKYHPNENLKVINNLQIYDQ